jgi:hypothetical protein
MCCFLFCSLSSCLQSLLSSSSSWYDPSSSQPSIVLDLRENNIDARGQAALHACVQQAALIASKLLATQPNSSATHKGLHKSGPSVPLPISLFRVDLPSSCSSAPSSSLLGSHASSALSGSGGAPGSVTSSTSSAAAAAVALPTNAAGVNVFVWPSLRAPAFSSNTPSHVARLLQQAGCVAPPTAALQVLCMQQQHSMGDLHVSSIPSAEG